jgi:hypothetical protein
MRFAPRDGVLVLALTACPDLGLWSQYMARPSGERHIGVACTLEMRLRTRTSRTGSSRKYCGELSAQKAYFETILDRLDAGIVVLDPLGRFAYASASAHATRTSESG